MKKKFVLLIFACALILVKPALNQISNFNLPQNNEGGSWIFDIVEADGKLFAYSTKAKLIMIPAI